jgi:hypothetical protein
MKAENVCLDLTKVQSIKRKADRERIYNMYGDMLHFYSDRREISMSFYNTLEKAGYLIDIRAEKIDKVLEESNEV